MATWNLTPPRHRYTDSLRSRLGHPRPAPPNYKPSLMALIARDACERLGMEWRVRNNLLGAQE